MSHYVWRRAAIVTFVATIACSSIAAAQQNAQRTFYVNIAKNQEIAGHLLALTELKIKTSFGEVSIPLNRIEAIKMEGTPDNKAVVAFINGDIVTGTLALNELQLKTNWGKAHIKSNSIVTISASRNGEFVAIPDGGWRYNRTAHRGIPVFPQDNFRNRR